MSKDSKGLKNSSDNSVVKGGYGKVPIDQSAASAASLGLPKDRSDEHKKLEEKRAHDQMAKGRRGGGRSQLRKLQIQAFEAKGKAAKSRKTDLSAEELIGLKKVDLGLGE